MYIFSKIVLLSRQSQVACLPVDKTTLEKIKEFLHFHFPNPFWGKYGSTSHMHVRCIWDVSDAGAQTIVRFCALWCIGCAWVDDKRRGLRQISSKLINSARTWRPMEAALCIVAFLWWYPFEVGAGTYLCTYMLLFILKQLIVDCLPTSLGQNWKCCY